MAEKNEDILAFEQETAKTGEAQPESKEQIQDNKFRDAPNFEIENKTILSTVTTDEELLVKATRNELELQDVISNAGYVPRNISGVIETRRQTFETKNKMAIIGLRLSPREDAEIVRHPDGLKMADGNTYLNVTRDGRPFCQYVLQQADNFGGKPGYLPYAMTEREGAGYSWENPMLNPNLVQQALVYVMKQYGGDINFALMLLTHADKFPTIYAETIRRTVKPYNLAINGKIQMVDEKTPRVLTQYTTTIKSGDDLYLAFNRAGHPIVDDVVKESTKDHSASAKEVLGFTDPSLKS